MLMATPSLMPFIAAAAGRPLLQACFNLSQRAAAGAALVGGGRKPWGTSPQSETATIDHDLNMNEHWLLLFCR